MNEEFSNLTDENLQILIRFAIAIGIGFLIGLEREFAKQVKDKEQQFAGIRTYTLVSIFGFLSSLISVELGSWFLPVAFLGLMALVTVSYIRLSQDPNQFGGTSEVSLILTFILGAVVFYEFILLAIIATVVILLLLTYKPHLHKFVSKLTQEEIRAIVQFVIISALVIPFLPDKDFGPYQAWNPRDIWKMVVLVSGISLAGYLLSKMFGERGTILAGIVGGLASSTAVSLSFSRRSKEGSDSLAPVYAVGILAASTIMFMRILFEVFVLNRELLKFLWIQLTVITVIGIIAGYFIYRLNKKSKQPGKLELDNPLNFSAALKFAAIYAAILWIVKVAQDQFGAEGVYVAAIISGITDVDAITISMAKLARDGNQTLAASAILMAAISNTIMKFVIVIVVGSPQLRKVASIGFASLLLAGIISLVVQLLTAKGEGNTETELTSQLTILNSIPL